MNELPSRTTVRRYHNGVRIDRIATSKPGEAMCTYDFTCEECGEDVCKTVQVALEARFETLHPELATLHSLTVERAEQYANDMGVRLSRAWGDYLLSRLGIKP